MTGSEKQIKWATDILNSVKDDFNTFGADILDIFLTQRVKKEAKGRDTELVARKIEICEWFMNMDTNKIDCTAADIIEAKDILYTYGMAQTTKQLVSSVAANLKNRYDFLNI